MIDKKALTLALEDPDPGHVYVVDKKLQKVNRYTVQDIPGLQALKKAMTEDPKRFLQVPKPDPKETRAEMESFINGVQDPKLKEGLKRAMTGHRPLREARDLIQTKVKEKREWDIYHGKLMQVRVERFLKEHGLS